MAKRVAKALRLRQIKHDHNMMAMTAGAFAHMWLFRSMEVFKKQKQIASSNMIADVYLIHRTETWYHAMRLASIVVQCHVRGWLARRSYEKRRQAHRRLRLWAISTNIRMRYLKKRRLVIAVQKKFRMNVFRKWFRLARNAAKKIQFFWRFRNLNRRKRMWLHAMQQACLAGDVKTVKEMLFLPGSYRILNVFPNIVNIRDPIYGSTLVHSASKGGNVEILRLLLSRGIDLEALDGIGNTALHYSCVAGDDNFEFTQCLLTHVVDPEKSLRVLNTYEETPLDKLRDATARIELTERLMLRYGAVANASKRASLKGNVRRRASIVRETETIRKKREEETTKRQEVEAQKRLQNDAMYSLMMLNPDVVDPVSQAIRQEKKDRATKKLQHTTKMWLIGKRLKRRAQIGVLSEFDLDTSIRVSQVLHEVKESAEKKNTERRREAERTVEMNWRLKQMRTRLHMWTAANRVDDSSSPIGTNVSSSSPRTRRNRHRADSPLRLVVGKNTTTPDEKMSENSEKEMEEARRMKAEAIKLKKELWEARKKLENTEETSKEFQESLIAARLRIRSLELKKMSQTTMSENTSQAEKELEEARKRLVEAETKAREEHESFVAAKSRIEDLERKVQETTSSSREEEDDTTRKALEEAQKRLEELEMRDRKEKEDTQKRIEELQKQLEKERSEKKVEEDDPLPRPDADSAALYAVHSPFMFKARRTESVFKDDASETNKDLNNVMAPGLEEDLDPRRYRKTLLMHVKHIYTWLHAEPKHRGWYYIDNASQTPRPVSHVLQWSNGINLMS